MAKRHLITLAKELANLFESSEKIYADFALATQDMIIDDETMRPLLLQKVKLDNLLATYSTAIRAAVANRLEDLFMVEQRVQMSFAAPLLSLLDNLSEAPEDKITQSLIVEYNSKVQESKNRERILQTVKFYKNIPNRKKKSKTYLAKLEVTDILSAITSDMIAPVTEQLSILQNLYVNFLNTPIEKSDKGDFDE